MASASEMLGGQMASTASERLASNGKPTGKQGNAALTVKLRTKFAEMAADEPGIQFDEWLDKHGYGIGDNGQVYKK